MFGKDCTETINSTLLLASFWKVPDSIAAVLGWVWVLYLFGCSLSLQSFWKQLALQNRGKTPWSTSCRSTTRMSAYLLPFTLKEARHTGSNGSITSKGPRSSRDQTWTCVSLVKFVLSDASSGSWHHLRFTLTTFVGVRQLATLPYTIPSSEH